MAQIGQDQEELLKLEAELSSPAEERFAATSLLSMEDAQRRLLPGSALLLYSFLDEDLLIWGIPATGEPRVSHTTLDSRVLAGQIRTYCRSCRELLRADGLGDRLAGVLLAPVADLLEAYSRLIIVPSGEALALPFHALPWKGQPLVATHSVSYLPNASSLAFLKPTAVGPAATLLVTANPARMSLQPPLVSAPKPAAALPGTENEAALIARLFPRAEVLQREDATKERVKKAMRGREVLHFATHGHLAPEAPLLSSILLAEGESLSVQELVGERLTASLVVLSACETAGGRRTGGGEVLGLTRGLLAAGAGAALVSLWPVNDVATSLLMRFFYRELHQGAPAAAALWRAQNAMRRLSRREGVEELARYGIRDTSSGPDGEDLFDFDEDISLGTVRAAFSNPYYWAAFVLVGI
jgi:CHAT domain-containing protein